VLSGTVEVLDATFICQVLSDKGYKNLTNVGRIKVEIADNSKELATLELHVQVIGRRLQNEHQAGTLIAR